jgi:hypothetical protein
MTDVQIQYRMILLYIDCAIEYASSRTRNIVVLVIKIELKFSTNSPSDVT